MSAAPPELEFFFDCSSPWTYLAYVNVIAERARTQSFTIRWRPFLVGGVFNTVNDTVYASRANPVPAKYNYMVKDLADWAAAVGVKINWRPSVFPVNSVKAMRGCLTLEPAAMERFASAVFAIYWSEDQDISRDEVIAEACARADVDARALLAAIQAPAVKEQLRANTDELVARGGFGTPTMFVRGDDMYFGNDRLPLVFSALRAAAA